MRKAIVAALVFGVTFACSAAEHPVLMRGALLNGEIFADPRAESLDETSASGTVGARDLVVHESDDGCLQTGVYETGRNRYQVDEPYEHDEFMYFLQGGVTLSSGDGTVIEAVAGIRDRLTRLDDEPLGVGPERYRDVGRALGALGVRSADVHPLHVELAVPAAVATCSHDVAAAVAFARHNKLDVAIRGGGHNGAGLAMVDDGLVIDLSPMKGIHVDPAARTVRVAGGCTWGEVDQATHAHGLAVPSGIISTTGVGGLTLGGGLGYLSRAYGLTIDNLLAVDIVLADGRLVTADKDENPDLFWAVRGGGGNFGVVTSFLFQAQPVGTVYGGPIIWLIDQTETILCWPLAFIADSPVHTSRCSALHPLPTRRTQPAEPFTRTDW